MTNEPLNNQYNDAASGGAADNAEGAKPRRRQPRGKVVDFADADDSVRAAMEKLMEPIAATPDDFEVMISYGNAPLDKLGKIADQMLKIQQQFESQVNVLGTALDKLQTGMKEMNFHTMGGRAREALENLARGAGKGAKGLGRLVGGMWEAASGAKAKRSEDEKVVREMQDALPEMMREMSKLVEDIKGTERGIKVVMIEANKLGAARADATRELALYIGTGKEILRRYNEEYIPEAQELFEESGDPEDEVYLRNVVKRSEGFIDRMTVLEGGRAASVIAMKQLDQILDTLEDQRTKVQDIVRNSQNEWKAMLTAAGIAGSTLKNAQNIKKADDFGDKLHEQTMNMIEQAHTLTQSSRARGTIDPQKLIEASSRLTAMIESEAENRRNRLAVLEQTQTQLRTAADALLEAAEATDRARLESVDSSNDNDSGARQPVRRRKSGPAPE